VAEHHYIIKFDDVTKEWSQDVDSEEARFVDGTIYDEEQSSWFSPYQGDGQFYRNADKIDEQLSSFIEGLNK
jgi:hypothetical protein